MSAAQLIHALTWLENGERGTFRALGVAGQADKISAMALASRPAAPLPAPAARASAPRIIISGAPASGKGTQCEGIVETYGVKHISTGDLLRAAVVQGTELGRKAKGFMERGELVPDELLIPLVAEGLKGNRQGWLLDGFPRTQVQAEALRDAGVVPDALIVLEVPDELLVERCVHRRIDPETGKIYHLVTNPPESADVEERLIHRSDDTAEKIQTRLKLYRENADAVCSVFADQVRRVAGESDPKAIRAAIARIIDSETQQQLGVLLVGAPASGKGALSARLAQDYGLTRICVGDLLRAEIASGSTTGEAAKESLNRHEQVPDAILVQLICSAIKACARGYALRR